MYHQPYKNLLTKYHSDLEKLRTSSSQELSFELVKQICDSLEETMQSRIERCEFETAKPDYLSFETLDLELPGQYSYIGKPIPRQYRVKIAGMRSNFESQNHRHTSEVIKLLGNDAKTYRFRVKFGIGSLIEQRCQKLFHCINDSLKEDKACNERMLSLRTYNIVPISSWLGIVEEVEEVKNLEEFVYFSLKDKTAFQEAIRKYWYWIEHAGRGNQGEIACKSMCYKQALIKYRAQDVRQLILDCSRNIEHDLLRQTFVQISDNFVSFFKVGI